ncbi:MAG: hypothetical protein KBA72_03390 [Thermoanaerobaculia bacterium]|nr:hypothetical protein [Thermoanaerobaculia bacterium]
MAVKDLHDFLVSMSKHKSLRQAFDNDPDGVGSEANLTPEEVNLLSKGDEDEIRSYLGEKFGASAMIHVKP